MRLHTISISAAMFFGLLISNPVKARMHQSIDFRTNQNDFDSSGESHASESSSTSNHWWLGFSGQENVEKLNSSNYDVFIQSQPSALVMHYQQWCYYSQQSRSGFAGAAKELRKTNYPGALAALDCDESEIICDSKSIDEYPTILFYYRGVQKEEYQGENNAKEIIAFMNSKL